MATDAELLAPVTPEDQTPPPEPPKEEAKAEPETPASEDADLDKIVAEQSIDLPDGADKLVPLAAVENARAKLKTVRAELEDAKKGSARSTELETQVQQLQQQIAQIQPYAQAYQAALQAQPPETPKGPTPEEAKRLESIAKRFDFYKTDGSLDLGRAQEHLEEVRHEAKAIAKETVAPYQQQTTASASASMLRNAKLTTLSDGSKPAPEVLDYVWGQLDHSVTSTKEGAQQAFAVAVGYAQMLGKMQKGTAQATTKEPVPPPILTEKSGGKISAGPTLTEADKRAAKDLGMTEKQYADELATMPQGWGKR